MMVPPLSMLVFYSFTAAGVAWVVGHARISRRVREWLYSHKAALLVDFLECPGCFGWWFGFGVGAIVQGIPLAVACAFYTAGFNMLIVQAIVRLTDLNDKEPVRE